MIVKLVIGSLLISLTMGAAPPVVVELFTSEGCSSCPPADALLAKLHRARAVNGVEVIVLSEHVDYWNRLGWTDPFSSTEFSNRQRWYSNNWPRSMYTPQIVIDGAIEKLGNDPIAVNRGIMVSSLKEKANITLDAAWVNEREIKAAVTISDFPATPRTKLDVIAAVLEDDLTTQVPRGENKGRTLRHMGVVRSLERFGHVKPNDNGPINLQSLVRAKSSWTRENLRLVILLQDPSSRHIIGAAASSVSAHAGQTSAANFTADN